MDYPDRREDAREVAEFWLEDQELDDLRELPACILAREFLRALAEIEQLKKQRYVTH